MKHKTDKKKNIQIHAKNNELQNSNKSKSCTTISNNKTKLSKIIQQGGTPSKIIQDRNRQYQNSILSQQNDQITKEKTNIQINGNTIIKKNGNENKYQKGSRYYRNCNQI